MDTLDCRGLVCPMPIIQTRLKLNTLSKGDEFLILADDETFDADFARFCYLADIQLLSKRVCGDFQEYHIKILV